MARSFLLFAFAALAAACTDNVVTCGAGTLLHEDSNGNFECLPADCDLDAGALPDGGLCTQAVICGPGTTLLDGECVVSGGPGSHIPSPCGTPTAGKICINGVVRHLADDSYLSGETLRVAVYDPLALLNAPLLATPLASDNGVTDTYLFSDVAVPATGLIALAVSDSTGGETVLQFTAVGAAVSAGQSYQIDSYATPISLVTSWANQAGVNYDGLGALVAKYYLDASESPERLTATETMPASGVQMVQAGSVASTAKYFSTDLGTLGTTTSTSSVGAALIAGSGSTGSPAALSGSGSTPGTNWETYEDASAEHLVFVQRLHPCVQSGGVCTN